METRGAGAGQLTVRIRGPKGKSEKLNKFFILFVALLLTNSIRNRSRSQYKTVTIQAKVPLKFFIFIIILFILIFFFGKKRYSTESSLLKYWLGLFHLKSWGGGVGGDYWGGGGWQNL